MAIESRKVRVAIYGAGGFAVKTHIPNLLRIDDVDIVAVCRRDERALQSVAERFGIPKTYRDAHEMLDQEEIDILFSVVPAWARTDVEIAAALKGIHLFCEKPQALTMKVAHAIDAALRQSGVLSTVCFRERYRPLYQKARELLRGKSIYHVRFQSLDRELPALSSSPQRSWYADFEKSGCAGLDWGVHAMDYTRFMTGLEVKHAQSFYCRKPDYCCPLSWIFNYSLSNDATMTLDFISSAHGSQKQQPSFTVFFTEGCLEVCGTDRIEVDGETVYRGQEFDPWYEQTRVFVEAVRAGNSGGILNDFHDGLFSLSPILAGWESARRDGERVDVELFMRVSP